METNLHDLHNPRANQNYLYVGKRKAARVLNYYAAFKAQENQRFLARFRLDYAVYNFIGDKILAPYLSDIKKQIAPSRFPTKRQYIKKICMICIISERIKSYLKLFVHLWQFKLFIIQSSQFFLVGKRNVARVLNYYAAFKAQKNQRFLARFRLDYTVYNFIGDKILAPYLSDTKKQIAPLRFPTKQQYI